MKDNECRYRRSRSPEGRKGLESLGKYSKYLNIQIFKIIIFSHYAMYQNSLLNTRKNNKNINGGLTIKMEVRKNTDSHTMDKHFMRQIKSLWHNQTLQIALSTVNISLS